MPVYGNFLGEDDTDVMGPTLDEEMLRRFPPATQPPPAEPGPLDAPPPLELNGAAGLTPTAGIGELPTLMPNAAVPEVPGSGYQPKLSELEALYGQRPVMEKPKWWQRAAGAAAGFGAGWSNAASRSKHPIDIGAMEQNILYPGYRSKLEQWQSKVTPLEAQAGIEGKKQEAWWKQRSIDSAEELHKAQAEQARQHGLYWAHRASMEQNQWKIDPKSGVIYNTITGERHGKPDDPASRKATALALGASEDMANYYALNGNMSGWGSTLANPQADKNANIQDILVNPEKYTPAQVERARGLWGEMHRDPAAKGGSKRDFTAITARRNSRNIAAENAAKAALKANPEDTEKIYAQLREEKQRIQNDFENEVETHGGAAEHYEYPVAGEQAAPAAAAPTAATQGKPKKALKDIFGARR